MSKKKIKYTGIILTILSAIGLTFILFNSIFQTFEFFVKYQLIAFLFFILSFVASISYAVIENLDGKGF